jgi:hypothetical protein
VDLVVVDLLIKIQVEQPLAVQEHQDKVLLVVMVSLLQLQVLLGLEAVGQVEQDLMRIMVQVAQEVQVLLAQFQAVLHFMLVAVAVAHNLLQSVLQPQEVLVVVVLAEKVLALVEQAEQTLAVVAVVDIITQVEILALVVLVLLFSVGHKINTKRLHSCQ